MSVVCIREDTGKFLDQGRGQGRGWTSDLTKAQVFESAGRAKVAYNHATAYDREWNRTVVARNVRGLTDMSPHFIPPFATREVRVVMELL